MIRVREEVEVDHKDKWVYLKSTGMSITPAEAKMVAAALVHYADRAQRIRDRADEQKEKDV